MPFPQTSTSALAAPPSPGALPYRSLFLHAWDLLDDGVEGVLASARDAGINTLCLAGTYHSGYFLQPSSGRRRSIMTEGSVCYFRPSQAMYTGLRLRPIASSLCDQNNVFEEVGTRLDQYGLRLVSWTIGVHNTRLGLQHPDLTQQNVFGDRLPHALCPSNDDVRAYLIALCRDLATNHPVWGLQLESFGWMSFLHGHHHERDLVELTPFEVQLLSICICPACTREAEADGVDVAVAAADIRAVLDGVFREAPNRPKGHKARMAELERVSPAVEGLNAWRKGVADAVIGDIRREALGGSSCRLLLQSGYDPALADVVDGFACGIYGQSPAEALATCTAAVSAIEEGWPGLMQCFVRLGMGVPKSESELAEIVNAVRVSGCNGIAFYNRSESPPKMLNWMSNLMRSVGQG